jgi:cyclopropane-fatty-acyl-phospholipid synthase
VSGDSALTTRPREGAAGLFMDVMKQVFGTEPPPRLRASGGSEGGPPDKPVVILRSRQALRRMMWHPGELGLAQAYVTAEVDVDGDVAEGLRAVWRTARYRGLADARPLRGAPRSGRRSCWACPVRSRCRRPRRLS